MVQELDAVLGTYLERIKALKPGESIADIDLDFALFFWNFVHGFVEIGSARMQRPITIECYEPKDNFCYGISSRERKGVKVIGRDETWSISGGKMEADNLVGASFLKIPVKNFNSRNRYEGRLYASRIDRLYSLDELHERSQTY